MRQLVKNVANKFLEDFPIFKRVATSEKNGDVYELTKSLTNDEKIHHFSPASGPDSFSDALNRVPDVSLIDKFEAIAQLNAAIAGINYVKSSDDEK